MDTAKTGAKGTAESRSGKTAGVNTRAGGEGENEGEDEGEGEAEGGGEDDDKGWG